MLREQPNSIRQGPAQTSGKYAVQQAAAIQDQDGSDSSRYSNRLEAPSPNSTDPWQTRPQRVNSDAGTFRTASTVDEGEDTNTAYQAPASKPWQASDLSEVAMPDTEIPALPLGAPSGPNGSPSLNQPIQLPPDTNNSFAAENPPSGPGFNRSGDNPITNSQDLPPALEDYQADATPALNPDELGLPETSREQSVLVREDAPSLSVPSGNSGTDENRLRELASEGNRPRDLRGKNISSPVNSRFRNTPKQRYYETNRAKPQEDDLQRIAEVDQSRGRKSCDDYRTELLNTPITDIVLDISPIRPVAAAQRALDGLNRTWKDCRGNVLAKGKLLGLERSYILVDDDSGQGRLISMSELSEVDLFVVTQYWGLPIECNLGCDTFQGRSWAGQSFFWKASALCHKPLYFENRALERYGHTHGPVVEPIHSAAHFFVNLFVWPYKSGINPPNECLYALGFYRPGDCAPWLKEPIPLSLHGAINQSLAIVAIGGIIP